MTLFSFLSRRVCERTEFLHILNKIKRTKAILMSNKYEQFDLSFSDAIKNEFSHGMHSLASKETTEGIGKFVGGAGRHGSFSKL